MKIIVEYLRVGVSESGLGDAFRRFDVPIFDFVNLPFSG